jgi:Ca2+/H+ antiporter, TMEM165/GDT1 family
MSGFGIILVSEMGDKTQLASAVFAATYNPWIVFFGVISALAILSAMAVFLGKFIMQKVNRKVISYVAGGLFIVIGVFCFF